MRFEALEQRIHDVHVDEFLPAYDHLVKAISASKVNWLSNNILKVSLISTSSTALPMVAEQCSPHKDLSLNPGKGAAIALADALPLVWGGSMLAARAARRIAEELRRVTGRAALATPAEDIVPILSATQPRDPFADPTDEPARPVLVTLDDGNDDRAAAHARSVLLDIAATQQVRVVELDCFDDTGPVGRHVSLLQQGLYAAAYLGVGLDEY